MVWLQRRSGMALKPKRSSFDAWGGGGSAFDTSTMWINRPLPSPVVVEDVVPRSHSTVAETQMQQSRKPRSRHFGLKLKLPWFGKKDNEKQRGVMASTGKRPHCQMSHDSDERSMAWQDAQTQEHGTELKRPGFIKKSIESDVAQPLSRLHTLPVHMDSRQSANIPESYARRAQSLELASEEQQRMPWQQRSAPFLGKVGEGTNRIRGNLMGSKSKWTQRASQSVVRMASRLRKSRTQTGPQLKDVSVGVSQLHKANHQAELLQRHSMGSFVDGHTVSGNQPSPLGLSSPPDNLFIPSGPPDTICMQPGDIDQHIAMGSSFANKTAAVGDPHTATVCVQPYPGRWSMDSSLSRSAVLSLWDPMECENKAGSIQGLEEHGHGKHRIQALESGAGSQVDHLLNSQGADRIGEGSPKAHELDAVEYCSRRRGFEGERAVARFPKSTLGPVGYGYEPHEDHHNQEGDNSIPHGQSRLQRVKRNSMAKKIFRDSYIADTKQEYSDDRKRPEVLGSSPGTPAGVMPHFPVLGVGSECLDSEQAVSCGAGVRPLSRDTQDATSSLQECSLGSVDCWNPQHHGSSLCAVETTLQQESTRAALGLANTTTTLRPSLALSDPHCTVPASWCDDHKICHVRTVTPSDRSLHVPSHIELAASCTSDGPMFHRSVFFEAAFSSGEDSDDEMDGPQRFTPSQFTLKWKLPQHRRWHSDALKGVQIFHDGNDDYDYWSHSRHRLDRSHRLRYSMSDYSRSCLDDYPDEPGFSLRTGTDSDLILPEFEDIEEHGYKRHGRSMDGGEKPRKTWLDELQEGAELRRKECTYRIACQRAIMQSMKETVQASKLAFERLRSGLCPQLTSRVPQLRQRWGGRRRAKRREEAVRAVKQDEERLWEDVPLST